MVDWTNVVLAAISLVVGVCIVVVTRFVVPWLKEKNLSHAAKVAVEAAEALYGRYHGQEKLEAAIETLRARGFNVDTQRVLQAIAQAWKELNWTMIEIGEKELPDEPAEQEG